MATISRIGFGQVEPNHLSAQRTGQIYAQLPAASTINTLENGQFVKYDYKEGVVNFAGPGEWMLVYNEEKLYEPRKTHKDFALQKDNFIGGVMTPRVFKTNIGDIYTTNCVGGANTSGTATYAGIAIVEGNYLAVDSSTGYLVVDTDGLQSTAPMLWQVVKITTVPSGKPTELAVKLMRVR